jgi:hypothetical protein
MGSSFTNFRGRGFWSRDALLEVWLRVLSLHMGDDVHKSGWQHDLRDQWLLASTGCFSGCVSASLDEFLTDSDRVAIILQTSERSIQSLRAFGAFVPATFLNALGLDGPFAADLPIEWFDLISDRFTALLRGELTTDASSSPVLPATRKDQRWDEVARPRSIEPDAPPNIRRAGQLPASPEVPSSDSQRTPSSGGCG